MKKILFFLLAAVLCIVSAFAGDSLRVVHSFGADIRGAHVFPSSSNLVFADEIVPLDASSRDYSKKISSLASFHAKYTFAYTSSTRIGRLYPGAYQGLGLGVFSFFSHKDLGTPVSLYFFQGAPIKHFSPRLSLGYEWNFGISAGWHKSNLLETPAANVFVGSRFNAYINLGFLLDYRFSDAVTLRGGVEMTHFSDGNTALPNPGVNALGARIGFSYAFGKLRKTTAKILLQAADSVKAHWSYDILIYGAASKKAVTIDEKRVASPGVFGIGGFSFSPMRTVNQYFRYGPSLDVKYDQGVNLQANLFEESTPDNVLFYRPPFRECIVAGISARAELVMPLFSVNVGIGRNLLCVSAAKKFYQTANLRIHTTDRLWINIGYQLHSFRHPDNLILGVGYTIH